METVEVLRKTGLNEKESQIYLALLELGTASVQSIAFKAGIKRPTTYLVLDDLQAKGLVSEVPQKKALYTAESPERLLGDLSKKEELLKRFLPDLVALHNAKKEKPQAPPKIDFDAIMKLMNVNTSAVITPVDGFHKIFFVLFIV